MSKRTVNIILLVISLIGYSVFFYGIIRALWEGTLGVKIAISGWIVASIFSYILKGLKEVSGDKNEQ